MGQKGCVPEKETKENFLLFTGWKRDEIVGLVKRTEACESRDVNFLILLG